MSKKAISIIAVILAVWLFIMGIETGRLLERRSSADPGADESSQITTRTLPTTVPQSTTEPAATTVPPITTQKQEDSTTTQPAESTTTQQAESTTEKKEDKTTSQKASTTNQAKDPSQYSTEEIIAEMKKAFKTVEAEKNMTAVKTEEINIQLTDLSVKALLNTVNNVIQGLAGAEQNTYTFKDGVATGVDAEGNALEGTFTMDGLLPPDGREWTCDPAGVASATATKNGDYTVYKILLVEENTTFTEPIPPYSYASFAHLDLTSIDLPVGKITDANMHYKGTSVSITVDDSGRVHEIHYNMPMDGYGAASLGPVSGNASFEGYDDEVWQFTY